MPNITRVASFSGAHSRKWQTDWNATRYLPPSGTGCQCQRWGMLWPTNTYKRPVCYFSRDFSATFFPFFCLPSDVPPICFAFLEGPKHFIALDLPRDAPFPMPPVVDYWSKKAKPLALEWEMWYSDHKDLYKAHMPPPSSIKESTVIELDD